MSKVKKTPYKADVTQPFQSILPLDQVRARLEMIFPATFPDRTILIGIMAARVVFVFLYGGFIEGAKRFLRPSYVYFFTEEQAAQLSDQDRLNWVINANKQKFRPTGVQWYADTSREPIRDDLMRNQLMRLGIMRKNQPEGHATTSMTPISYLTADFAALFNPSMESTQLDVSIVKWRDANLDAATLSRMALLHQGVEAKEGDILVKMPDGTVIRISSGPSNEIIKDLIENFAPLRLKKPMVLWLSASDKKSYSQFVDRANSVGLQFDLNAVLPDLILGDLSDPIVFYFCEVVASDGAVTEMRKQEFLKLVETSKIPQESVLFLTAFEDRSARPFRKVFSQLATDSLVWFRTEPDTLLIISTETRWVSEEN